jgi:hypothetical protein
MGDRHLDEAGFRQLMQSLADAWESGDIEAGLRCFAADAAYMEPPDIQLFAGQDELGQYFGAVEPGAPVRCAGRWSIRAPVAAPMSASPRSTSQRLSPWTTT